MDYSMNKYLKHGLYDQLKHDFFPSACGVEEEMNPGIIHQPKWPQGHLLFIYTHTEMLFEYKGENFICPPSSGILWESGTPCSYGWTSNKWKHSWVIFSGKDVIPRIKQQNILVHKPFPLPGAEKIVKTIELLLCDLVEDNDECAILLAESLLARIQQTSVPKSPEQPKGIREAEQFMQQNFGQPLTLDMLANKAGMSVSHFRTLFCRGYGISPIIYLNQIRIQNAKKILQTQSVSCKEIAYTCGFSDQLYFSRVFRRFCGVSPSEYRKKLQQ